MAARTMRSLSWSPSVPTAISEFATEEGKSIALTVIIYRGRERKRDISHQIGLGKTSELNVFSSNVCQCFTFDIQRLSVKNKVKCGVMVKLPHFLLDIQSHFHDKKHSYMSWTQGVALLHVWPLVLAWKQSLRLRVRVCDCEEGLL